MSRSGGSGRPNGGVVHFPTLDGDTFQDAPCHTEEENLWEPARDQEPDRVARQRWQEAAQLCGYCPALAACARLADAQPYLSGVWAGRVPRIKGERIGSLTGCGTRSGYQQHRRIGEPACEECSAANREYSNQYNALRRRG